MSQRKNNTNELDQVFNPYPDEKFLDNLESAIINRYEDGPSLNLVQRIFMVTKKKAALIASLSIAVVAVGGMFSYPLLREQYIIRNTDLYAVLREADDSKNARNVAPNVGGKMAAELASDSMMIGRAMPDYKYYSNLTKYKYGAAASRCEALVYSVGSEKIGSYEYYHYYDQDKSFYKDITKGTDGKTLYYNLSKDDVTYTYQGGQYAITYKNQNLFEKYAAATEMVDEAEQGAEPTPLDEEVTEPGAGSTGGNEIDGEKPVENPVDEMPEPQEPVVDEPIVWGDNQKLVGIEKLNGEDHYVISYEYRASCSLEEVLRDTALENSNQGDTLITVVVYINKETSEISRELNYFGKGTSDANLIKDYTNESVTSNVALSSVSSKFNFDLNTQVVDISDRFENSYSLTKMKESGIDLVLPKDSIWKVAAIYSPKFSDPFAENNADRAFYPAGPTGDSMLAEYLKNIGMYESKAVGNIISDYSINNSAIYGNVEVKTYALNTSVNEILKEHGLDLNGKKIGDVTIMINGQSVTAAKYVYSYEPETAESSSPSSGLDKPDEFVDESENYYLVFTHNGYRYYASYYSQQGGSALQFYTLNSNSDFELLKQLLPKM